MSSRSPPTARRVELSGTDSANGSATTAVALRAAAGPSLGRAGTTSRAGPGAAVATATQVPLELRGDHVPAGLVERHVRVAAFLEGADVVADVLVLLGHLADGPLPLLGLF